MSNHHTLYKPIVRIIAALLSFALVFSVFSADSPTAFAADPVQTVEPTEEPPVTDVSPAAEESENFQIIEADGAEYMDGEVIVKFKDAASDYTVQTALDAVDSEIQETLPDDNLLIADVPEGESVESFIDTLEDQPNVEYAQPNYVYHLLATTNDTYLPLQWHLNTINVFDAWDITMGSPNVKVAVIDSGIDLDHPEFDGQIYRHTDLINGDGSADDKVDGHGTHVAGIIAAKANNGIGVAGIAPGVQLIVIDVFNGTSTNTGYVTAGVNYAVTNGADIINMSLGGSGDDPTLKAAIDSAVSNGVVCVAAAGNEYTDDPCYPSDYDSVISVIATDDSDNKADFSNFGDAKDISAPGVDIASTYPVTLYPYNYAYSDGTSMATPVISGVVALMLSANPDLTVDEIKNNLYSTAVDLGTPGKDSTYGYGRVDALEAVSACVLTPVDISCSKTDVTVYGGSDGSVTISALGGNSGSYEYSINGCASWQGTGAFSGLAAGTYTAAVRDAVYPLNTATQSVTVSQPDPTPVGISCTKTDATIYGGSNGSVTVTASGGDSGEYEYSINGGESWQSTGAYSNLAAGTYTAVVRDKTYPLNTATQSVTIDQPAPTPVGISCTKTDVSVYGGSDGSVTVSASGGNSGSYEYSINDGASWQGTGDFGGLAAGTYTAAVRDAGYTSNVATCSVSVGQPSYMGNVAAKKIPTKVNAGNALTIVPPAAPRGYTIISVTYSSSNPSVATVDASGTVTFLAGGKTKIITKIVSQMTDKKGRVRTKTTTVKKTITVKQPVASIALNLGDTTIARTQRVKLIPSFAPATASSKKVKWTTSNKKVATVSSSGVVTGKAGGTAVITCTAKDGSGVTASCTVTITPIYPTGIRMSKAALTVKTGRNTTLRATITPRNTDFKTLIWASSDPSVATVDAKGKVRGITPGTAVITATTSSGQTASCTVTVK